MKRKLIAVAVVLAVCLALELFFVTHCSSQEQTAAESPVPTQQVQLPPAQQMEADTEQGSSSWTAPQAPAQTSAYIPQDVTGAVQSETQTQSWPAAESAPEPAADTPAPAPTAPPSPTPSPTPSPSPTPAPTAPPTAPPITGTVTASGSFSSSTGTPMDMSVSWQAVSQEDGTVEMVITGVISSYSLQATTLPVSISFGGYATSCMGAPIDVPDDVLTTSHLFSATLDVPAGTAGDMTVTWSFGGSYSGTDLPTVTASGYVNS